VTDARRAVLLSATRKLQTSEQLLQVKKQQDEVARKMVKLVNLPLPRDDPRQRRPDTSLAKAELGWQPAVRLQDGLRPTIAFIEAGTPIAQSGGATSGRRHILNRNR
jgi:nucleoside-diphosphate-sugar epimerase